MGSSSETNDHQGAAQFVAANGARPASEHATQRHRSGATTEATEELPDACARGDEGQLGWREKWLSPEEGSISARGKGGAPSGPPRRPGATEASPRPAAQGRRGLDRSVPGGAAGRRDRSDRARRCRHGLRRPRPDGRGAPQARLGRCQAGGPALRARTSCGRRGGGGRAAAPGRGGGPGPRAGWRENAASRVHVPGSRDARDGRCSVGPWGQLTRPICRPQPV